MSDTRNLEARRADACEPGTSQEPWPVLSRVVGEQEFNSYDANLLADHITAFSLAALGLAPPLGEKRRLRAIFWKSDVSPL